MEEEGDESDGGNNKDDTQCRECSTLFIVRHSETSHIVQLSLRWRAALLSGGHLPCWAGVAPRYP